MRRRVGPSGVSPQTDKVSWSRSNWSIFGIVIIPRIERAAQMGDCVNVLPCLGGGYVSLALVNNVVSRINGVLAASQRFSRYGVFAQDEGEKIADRTPQTQMV